MKTNDQLMRALSSMPVVPALRGITLKEARIVAETLIRLGVKVLEVPLRTKNPAFSAIEPDALEVLKFFNTEYQNEAVVVAGTVMNHDDLDVLQKLGVNTCMSLNLQTDLVKDAAERGLYFFPGVETVTEAIAATKAGASGLKLFPAVIREPDGGTSVRITPGFVSYLCRFLPIPMIPSGNSFDNGMASAYLKSGATAVNIGAQLYEPAISAETLEQRFFELMRQFDRR